MAYETGTPSSTQDLMQKLSTFAQGLSTTPWTEDNLDLVFDKLSLHLGNCYVHFKWDSTAQTTIGMFQSLGFAGSGADQDAHTNDSGNGDDPGVAPVVTERRVDFGVAGPYTAYHFFAGEGDEPYIHVVVEVTSGVFRHFGFGNLVKTNDWTGGEYCYAHLWDSGAAYTDNPTSPNHTFMLDGITASYLVALAATVHVEGMPNGPTSHKWGACCNLGKSAAGNDGDGNGRCPLFGSSRSGLWGFTLLWMNYSHINSYKALVPIVLCYRDTDETPDEILWLGQMPEVGLINHANFDPGDEITVGSDTYMIFPWVRKQTLGADTQESRNGGIAYKKVV